MISPGAKVSNLSSELGSDTANKFQGEKEIHSFWSLVDDFLLHLAAQVSTPLWSGICKFLLSMVVVFVPTSHGSEAKKTHLDPDRPGDDQSLRWTVNMYANYVNTLSHAFHGELAVPLVVNVRRPHMVLRYETPVLSFAIHIQN